MSRRLMTLCLVLVSGLAILPATADEGTHDPVADLTGHTTRYVPGETGVACPQRLVFGPYVIPPGQDNNKVTLDLPGQTGFMMAVQPNLINVDTSEEFDEQTAHIHHAHWFRVTNDQDQYYYSDVTGADTDVLADETGQEDLHMSAGLSWVFGTGEERTGGSLLDRSPTNANYVYGIFVDGNTPQALIFMIHNKTPRTIVGYITLDTIFTPGTRDQIKSAQAGGAVAAGCTDIRGKDVHPLTGVLTGTTRDSVAGVIDRNSVNGVLMQWHSTSYSGTLVAAGSHMHPGGKRVYVVNLGPRYTVNVEGEDVRKFRCAEAGSNGLVPLDIDGDGIPGTTLFISDKTDHVAATWPYSEDYQMGGTQFGFRAPIHKGDIIKQYGVYDIKRSSTMGLPNGLFELDGNGDPILGSLDGKSHAWYEAMSYTGLYTDTDASAQPPLAGGITNSAQCSLANFAPTLVDANAPNPTPGDARTTMLTHPWWHLDQVCGVPGDPADTGACEKQAVSWVDGGVTDTIHLANFVYLPGNMVQNAATVTVPLVRLGSKLRMVNEDIAIGVRHTFTSCRAPCNGTYVANYPLPDGLFDTGKLGNLDYIDGGLFQDDDTLPYKEFTVDGRFTAGQVYTYYCSIHPTMRGAFKVIPAPTS